MPSWGYEDFGGREAIMRAKFDSYFHLKRSISGLRGIRWAAINLVAGTVVALAGCAGQAIEPEPRIVRVEVPVVVPCQTDEVAVPPWAAAGLRKGDSLELKVRVLLAERRQRIGYERKLLAANEACR